MKRANDLKVSSHLVRLKRSLTNHKMRAFRPGTPMLVSTLHVRVPTRKERQVLPKKRRPYHHK